MTGQPHWTMGVSAFAITIVAIFGAYIAWNLWKTNRDILRERTFDRRFEIFKATQTVISRIGRDEGISWHSANELSDIAQQARFMFSEEDAQYFDILRQNALALAKATSETDGVRMANYASQKDQRYRLCGWFDEQVEELFSRMSKYLLFNN